LQADVRLGATREEREALELPLAVIPSAYRAPVAPCLVARNRARSTGVWVDMTSLTDRLGELRLGDLATFLAVRRTGSITSAARELAVTPSQVSKAITRLEHTLRLHLLTRGSRGVSLSEAGLRVLPHVEAAVARLLAIGNTNAEATELKVAGPSYLLASFLPTIQRAQPQLRIRGIELPPALLRAYSSEDFFDMCLIHAGMDGLPPSWSSVHVGVIRQALFASPALARRLGPQPLSVDRIRTVPFISPVYHADGHLMPALDDCPLPRSDREVGDQVLTIMLALELAARSEQVAFGPYIAARGQLAGGTLVEVRVQGWNVRSELNLACNGHNVLARVRNAVAEAVRAELAAESQEARKPNSNGALHVRASA
jgi:DNA-binding transcriptional LysR family regulator